MARLDQTSSEWDRVVDAYETAFEPCTVAFAEATLELARPAAGDLVLDLCTGTGALAVLADRLGMQVVAVDFAPAMVLRTVGRLARPGREPPPWGVVMDGQHLGFSTGAFDAAFSVFGSMFFPDHRAGVAEMRRVVRPGGVVSVVTWGEPGRVGSQRALAEAVTEALPDISGPAGPPPWAGLQHPDGLAADLVAAGLEDVAVHTVVRGWCVPSADWLWAWLPHVSPVAAPLFRALDVERTEALGQAFVRRLRRQFGDGPLTLEGEAHIGLGRVPEHGSALMILGTTKQEIPDG